MLHPLCICVCVCVCVYVYMCVCVFLSFACVVIRSFMQAHLYSKDQAEGLELSGKALSLSISKILRSAAVLQEARAMYQTAGPKGLYGDL